MLRTLLDKTETLIDKTAEMATLYTEPLRKEPITMGNYADLPPDQRPKPNSTLPLQPHQNAPLPLNPPRPMPATYYTAQGMAVNASTKPPGQTMPIGTQGHMNASPAVTGGSLPHERPVLPSRPSGTPPTRPPASTPISGAFPLRPTIPGTGAPANTPQKPATPLTNMPAGQGRLPSQQQRPSVPQSSMGGTAMIAPGKPGAPVQRPPVPPTSIRPAGAKITGVPPQQQSIPQRRPVPATGPVQAGKNNGSHPAAFLPRVPQQNPLQQKNAPTNVIGTGKAPAAQGIPQGLQAGRGGPGTLGNQRIPPAKPNAPVPAPVNPGQAAPRPAAQSNAPRPATQTNSANPAKPPAAWSVTGKGAIVNTKPAASQAVDKKPAHTADKKAPQAPSGVQGGKVANNTHEAQKGSTNKTSVHSQTSTTHTQTVYGYSYVGVPDQHHDKGHGGVETSHSISGSFHGVYSPSHTPLSMTSDQSHDPSTGHMAGHSYSVDAHIYQPGHEPSLGYGHEVYNAQHVPDNSTWSTPPPEGYDYHGAAPNYDSNSEYLTASTPAGHDQTQAYASTHWEQRQSNAPNDHYGTPQSGVEQGHAYHQPSDPPGHEAYHHELSFSGGHSSAESHLAGTSDPYSQGEHGHADSGQVESQFDHAGQYDVHGHTQEQGYGQHYGDGNTAVGYSAQTTDYNAQHYGEPYVNEGLHETHAVDSHPHENYGSDVAHQGHIYSENGTAGHQYNQTGTEAYAYGQNADEGSLYNHDAGEDGNRHNSYEAGSAGDTYTQDGQYPQDATYTQDGQCAQEGLDQQADYGQEVHAQQEGVDNQGGYDQSGYDQGVDGQGVHDQGGVDQPGYDQGVYDQGGLDQSGYDQGVDNQSGYDQGVVDQGGYEQGGYDQGVDDQGGYDQVAVDQGSYDQGGYDQGVDDQGGYDQGVDDQGGYDQGEYDQGEYDQGEYDQGEYDQGEYDQGEYGQEDVNGEY